MNRDYIPKSILKFILWAENLLDCIRENFERWQVPCPDPYLQAPLDDLTAKYQTTLQANSGKVDVVAKNDVRKTAVFCLRYENAKGKLGEWGPIIYAVIP